GHVVRTFDLHRPDLLCGARGMKGALVYQGRTLRGTRIAAAKARRTAPSQEESSNEKVAQRSFRSCSRRRRARGLQRVGQRPRGGAAVGSHSVRGAGHDAVTLDGHDDRFELEQLYHHDAVRLELEQQYVVEPIVVAVVDDFAVRQVVMNLRGAVLA